jgi:hypothetical protein
MAIVSYVAIAPAVRADEKKVCVAASEKGQELRNAGKLTEAREQLVVCSRPECPKLVQADCTQWLRDLLGAIPTVVLAAKDPKGRDILAVTVAIDGKVVTETLDGKPITIDPGAHTFRFESKDAPPVEQQVLVRQGETDRLVTVTLTPREAKPTAGPGTGAEVKSDGLVHHLVVPAFIGAGLGLAGGGVALYLGLDADDAARNLRDTCAPRCAQADVDGVSNRQNVARIVGIASGAVFAVSVVVLVIHYASGGGKSAASAKAGFTLAPTSIGESTVMRF